MTDELDSCPFCGSLVADMRTDESGEPYIYCYSCDAVYYNAMGTKDALIHGWNKRDSLHYTFSKERFIEYLSRKVALTEGEVEEILDEFNNEEEEE